MPLVMLKPNWPATAFRRTISRIVETKDAAGKIRRTLDPIREVVFPRGEPVELTDDERQLIAPDVGQALLDVHVDDKKRPRIGTAPETPPESSTESRPSAPADEPPATEAQPDAADAAGRSGRRRRADVPRS